MRGRLTRAYYPPPMRRMVPALCACLTALAACGDDDEVPRTAELKADEPIRMTADEYRFDPGAIKAASAARGIRITLVNRGKLAHNIRVMDGDRELGGVQSFPPGEERSATVRLAPGTYRFVCTVGDHEQLGMKGELVVGE